MLIDQLFVDSQVAIASQLTLHEPGESAEPAALPVLLAVGVLDAAVEGVLVGTVLVGALLVGELLVGALLVVASSVEGAAVVKVEDSLEVVSPAVVSLGLLMGIGLGVLTITGSTYVPAWATVATAGLTVFRETSCGAPGFPLTSFRR